jgi:glycosyltransferase involved in cell wall biosynthesis
LVVSFCGNLGHQYDLVHAVDAIRLLNEFGHAVQLVVCGTGERLDELRRYAAHVSSVLFAGWVDAAKIYVLMRRSCVGLNPLPDRYDYLATINNKAVEYLSAALPIISCPRRGILYGLLQKEECGLSYDVRDTRSLAAILRTLVEDPTRLKIMSANARRVFTEQFEAQTICTEMSAYLEDIVSTFGLISKFQSAKSA